jgi:hypothetical protein
MIEEKNRKKSIDKQKFTRRENKSITIKAFPKNKKKKLLKMLVLL